MLNLIMEKSPALSSLGFLFCEVKDEKLNRKVGAFLANRNVLKFQPNPLTMSVVGCGGGGPAP